MCPEVAAALSEANPGHTLGYGDDSWTSRACELLRRMFETDCEVFFVFNGTAANALALSTLCRPFEAILCHEHAHIHCDECAAPEFFTSGAKLLPLEGAHGRLDPGDVENKVQSHFALHSSKPAVLSLTQNTECGTAYRASQIRELARVAHQHGLSVHMDGARLANAVAYLDESPADLTWRAGVDLLSLGMTKNGGLCSEAILVFDRTRVSGLDYRIKQSGQLASKMRFLGAAWTGLLESNAWLKHARHANAMAQRLAEQLSTLPGVTSLHPCEGNGVFVDLPLQAISRLHEAGWQFYVFEGETGCRLMTSWDTREEDVDALTADMATCLG